jgi:hypothetical protein
MYRNLFLIISLITLVRSDYINMGRNSHSSAHGNAYVRSSVTDAIAEGVEHWPQVIGEIVHKLQDYYRDKVGLPLCKDASTQLPDRPSCWLQSLMNM